MNSSFNTLWSVFVDLSDIQLVTKRKGRTAKISARGPCKKDRVRLFFQYGPEQAWLIRDYLCRSFREIIRSDTWKLLDRQMRLILIG